MPQKSAKISNGVQPQPKPSEKVSSDQPAASPSDLKERLKENDEAAKKEKGEDGKSLAKVRVVDKAVSNITTMQQMNMGYRVQALRDNPKSLKVFDLKTLRVKDRWLLIGSSEAGKSNLQAWMMKQRRDLWPRVVIITSTKSNGFWQKFVLPKRVIGDFYPAMLDQILKRGDRLSKRHADGEVNRSIFVGTEDLSHRKDVNRFSEIIDQFYSSGRHHGVTTCMSVHKFNTANPHIRQQASLVFVSQQDGMGVTKEIARTWMGLALENDLKLAINIIEHNTEDYEFLVIDRRVKSRDPYKRYFRIRANIEELYTNWTPELEDKHPELLKPSFKLGDPSEFSEAELKGLKRGPEMGARSGGNGDKGLEVKEEGDDQ